MYLVLYSFLIMHNEIIPVVCNAQCWCLDDDGDDDVDTELKHTPSMSSIGVAFVVIGITIIGKYYRNVLFWKILDTVNCVFKSRQICVKNYVTLKPGVQLNIIYNRYSNISQSILNFMSTCKHFSLHISDKIPHIYK